MVSVHGHLSPLLLVGMAQYQMTGAYKRPGYPIASGMGQEMEGSEERRKVGGGRQKTERQEKQEVEGVVQIIPFKGTCPVTQFPSSESYFMRHG